MRRSSGTDRRLSRARVRPLAAVALALCLLVGCSSGHATAGSGGTVARVTERDFHISVSPARVSAGRVVLTVHNRGPENHELIVVRLRHGALPLRADGITVDEKALKRSTIGGLEPGAAGETRELRVTLTPGRYELFCNMSGHYLGGMHAELTVS